MYSVLVVEDNKEVRSRICRAVNDDPSLKVFAEAGTLSEARKLLENELPAIVLIDLGLPDGGGESIISWLQKTAPQVETLVLTVFGDEAHVVSAIESGASGYLLKCDAVESICQNIRLVLNGESPISPAVARHILNLSRKEIVETRSEGNADNCHNILTPTEIDVLRYIAKGYTAPEIAEKTGKSRNTVPVHIRNIYKKLSVHGRGEAVYQAIKMGIIGSDKVER